MSSSAGREKELAGQAVDADRDILDRMSAADTGALEELYDRYRALAYGLAWRVTGDAGLAEDTVQEAFLAVWRNPRGYAAERGSVKTWLLAIVHHRAVDAVRRRRPVSGLPVAEEAPRVLSVPDVWGEVQVRLDGEQVRGALAVLPETQREAIELAYFEGLTQQEISARTGAPLGTVKGRMRLGLEALRRALTLETEEAR